jgi:hypothetical protein
MYLLEFVTIFTTRVSDPTETVCPLDRMAIVIGSVNDFVSLKVLSL